MRTWIAVVVMTCAASAVGAAAQTASPTTGKVQFLRCQSCHALSATGPAKIGPSLGGIVGRRVGSVAGYAYSPALQARTDLVWDEATLDRWLFRPASVVPGNKMAFAGMPKAADRAALIAYLRSAR